MNVSPAVLGSSPRRTGVYQYMYMYSLIRLFSRTRSNWLPNMLNTPSQAPSHLQLSASAEPWGARVLAKLSAGARAALDRGGPPRQASMLPTENTSLELTQFNNTDTDELPDGGRDGGSSRWVHSSTGRLHDCVDAAERKRRSCFRCWSSLEQQLFVASSKRSSEVDDAEPSEAMLNFYGIVLYELHVTPEGRPENAIFWASAGVSVAVLQLAAVFALILSSISRTCLYDDDCPLGYVCGVYSARMNTTTAVCLACSLFTRADGEAAPSMYGVGHLVHSHFDRDEWELTPRRRSLLSAANASDFCEQSIRQPWVQAWPEPPADFTTVRCAKTTESFLRATPFDYIILCAAFLFIATCMASDRHQQLYNRRLRQCWFPAPHRSWKAGTLKLIEMLLARGLIPNVSVAYLALLSATSFSAQVGRLTLARARSRSHHSVAPAAAAPGSCPRSLTPPLAAISHYTFRRPPISPPCRPHRHLLGAQDVLLNGLSMSFILVIDDELTKVVVSVTRRNQIERAMAEASKGGVVPFRELSLQSCACLFLSTLAMAWGIGELAQAKCLLVPTAVSVVPGFFLGILVATFLELAVHFYVSGLQARLDDRRALAIRVGSELLESLVAVALTLLSFFLAGLGYFD